MSKRIRIYMTGVGGQGTLTATTLLARVAVEQGVEVVAGEIHGMAQRGGVVESTVLLGGWKSPKLGFGEADIVLGFEPLETLRGLRYLKQGGVVFGSTLFTIGSKHLLDITGSSVMLFDRSSGRRITSGTLKLL